MESADKRCKNTARRMKREQRRISLPRRGGEIRGFYSAREDEGISGANWPRSERTGLGSKEVIYAVLTPLGIPVHHRSGISSGTTDVAVSSNYAVH